MYEAFGHSFTPAPLYEEGRHSTAGPACRPRGGTHKIDRLLREWGYILGGRPMPSSDAAQLLTSEVSYGPSTTGDGEYSALAALRASGHRSRLTEGPPTDHWSQGGDAAALPETFLFDQKASPSVRGRKLQRPGKSRSASQQRRRPGHWTPISEYRSADDPVQLDGGLGSAFRSAEQRENSSQRLDKPSFFGPGGLGCESLPGEEFYEADDEFGPLLG